MTLFLIGLGGVAGTFLLIEAVKGLFRFVEKRGWKVEEDAQEALELGVQSVWDNYVRDLKKKAEDGKLTKEEKAEARAMAWEAAVEMAKGPALAVLKALAPQALNSIISLIVQRRKKDAE